MGRGEIVSGGADGLYSVRLKRDTTRAQASRDTIQVRQTEATARIAALEAELVTAQAALTSALDDLDNAIDAYTPGGSFDAIESATTKSIEARGEVARIELELSASRFDLLNADKEIEQIDNLEADPVVSAWCADLTEDLTTGTEVGTMEIPDEVADPPTIIRPAFDPGSGSRAAYDVSRDGFLQPAGGSTVAQFAYNTMLLPGVQRWNPQYRLATVTAVDQAANTVDVDLDVAISKGIPARLYAGIDINQVAQYSDVQVEYMDCNSQPFEVNDRVVLEFARDWNTPTCIGFESNPKACALYWRDDFTGILESGTFDNGGEVGIFPISLAGSGYPDATFHHHIYAPNELNNLDQNWVTNEYRQFNHVTETTSLPDGSTYWLPNMLQTQAGWFISDRQHYWEWFIYGDGEFSLGPNGLSLAARVHQYSPDGINTYDQAARVVMVCYPGDIPDGKELLRDPPYAPIGTLGDWWTVDVTSVSDIGYYANDGDSPVARWYYRNTPLFIRGPSYVTAHLSPVWEVVNRNSGPPTWTPAQEHLHAFELPMQNQYTPGTRAAFHLPSTHTSSYTPWDSWQQINGNGPPPFGWPWYPRECGGSFQTCAIAPYDQPARWWGGPVTIELRTSFDVIGGQVVESDSSAVVRELGFLGNDTS